MSTGTSENTLRRYWRKLSYITRSWGRSLRLAEHGAILFLYAASFFALTWPSVLRFGTHIMSDRGDGLQMYWNVWWVRHAVLNGAQPFETSLLFYPETPSLIVHSLHAFGGFLTVPFAGLLNDVALFNVVVTFGFVASGWGAYLLTQHFVKGTLPAFVAGYIFTFSNYHFAHATGHLNLVLMQWIPFYFLFLLRLLRGGRERDAVFAALFLFLTLLCDHYYFLFCVLASAIFILWGVWTKIALNVRTARAFALFGGLSLVTSGVFLLAFLRAAAGEVTGHDPRGGGMNPFALLVPGGHWRFRELTELYWGGSNIHETSVHLGLGVLTLAACGYYLLYRRRDDARTLLIALALAFFYLALGKGPQLAGVTLFAPYDLLEYALPPIRAGGVPVRFVVVTILMLAVLAACGVRLLWDSRRGRLPLALLLCLAFTELLPYPVPSTLVTFPPEIEVLAKRAAAQPGAVLDLAHSRQLAMLYQTRHKQPIQTGYLARMQGATERSYAQVQRLIRTDRFAELGSTWGFRYVLSEAPLDCCRLLYVGSVRLYEIPLAPDARSDIGVPLRPSR